jgi:hypothetical protein
VRHGHREMTGRSRENIWPLGDTRGRLSRVHRTVSASKRDPRPVNPVLGVLDLAHKVPRGATQERLMCLASKRSPHRRRAPEQRRAHRLRDPHKPLGIGIALLRLRCGPKGAGSRDLAAGLHSCVVLLGCWSKRTSLAARFTCRFPASGDRSSPPPAHSSQEDSQ